MLEGNRERSVSVRMTGPPPVKAKFGGRKGAHRREQNLQAKEELRKAAKQELNRRLAAVRGSLALSDLAPLLGRKGLRMELIRGDFRFDAPNIVGGIADALKGICYEDDSQVREICYVEKPGDQVEYTVTVYAIE
ncbi:MAG: RusA family crossover junction endodeoxyribonuclease [Dehalococcoidia bacterium]